MENSEVYNQVISLGKLLVQELEKHDQQHISTFTRWMAHYVAEKIIEAENSQGEVKINAQKDCFETILRLWNSRDVMPDRPFKSFEPILEMLQRLNPEKQEPYYFMELSQDAIDQLEGLDPSADWLKKASAIDKSAKISIQYCLAKAAKYAKSDLTEKWLEYSSSLGRQDDRNIIQIITRDDSILDLEDDKKFIKQYRSEKLKSRIRHFEQFLDESRSVMESLKNELNELEEQ
jgi:hypothetical protein